MRAYVAVSSRSAPIDLASLAAIESLAEVALPVVGVSQRSFVAPGGRSMLAFWSNEDMEGSDPAWWQSPVGAVAVVGQLDDPAAVGAVASSGDLALLERTLERSGGVYSACAQAGQSGEVRAWNTLPRVEAVYWQEANDRVVVSNRPLLAHLVATDSPVPRYALQNIVPFLNTGFYASEATPFEGLHVLPPHSELRLGVSGARIEARDESVSQDGDPIDAILDALQRACDPLRRIGQPVHCALTGGRDSRLLAAALRRAHVDFDAFTHGPPDHPDVILAARVAAILGVEHRSSIGAARASEFFTVDIPVRVAATLRATDGLLSGFENVPATPSRFDSRIVLNGHGGELLRGGYARFGSAADLESPEAFMRRLWFAAQPWLVHEVAATYQRDLQAIISRKPGESPAAVLDRVYLYYRYGRWAAASRMANSAALQLFQPLLDSTVLDTARMWPLAGRVDERLIFELTRRLVPALVDLPLVGSRWAFERTKAPAEDELGWRRRAPLEVTSTVGNVLDWRRTRGRELDRFFREMLLDASRSSRVFELVDRPALARTLQPTRPGMGAGVRGAAQAQVLWSAYSTELLLSNEWLRPRRGSTPVRIRTRPGRIDRIADVTLPMLRRVRNRARHLIRR